MQVLNEEIKDLLAGESSRANAEGATSGGGGAGLPLRENVQGEVTVAGLTQHEVRGRHVLPNWDPILGVCCYAWVRQVFFSDSRYPMDEWRAI